MLLCLLFAASCARGKGPKEPVDPRIPPAAREGAPPLVLELPKVGGGELDLSSLRGRPVILHLFTTWCYPCLAEVEELSKAAEDLRASGIEVVGIGLDLEGSKVLGPFAQSFDVPYPILIGRGDVLEGKSPLGKPALIPALFLLDKSGTVIGYRLGAGGAGWLEETRKRALGL